MVNLKKERRDYVMVSFSPEEYSQLITGMKQHSFKQKASYLKWIWLQHEHAQVQLEQTVEPERCTDCNGAHPTKEC
jgi:hypothetical protein